MDSVDADNLPTGGGEFALGNRYKIQSLAGQGGMGQVYRAWDRVLQRQVALKKISKSEDATLRRLAELEARTLAKISHPNVLTIYDVLQEDEGIWLVAEWIEGQSLEQIIATQGPLDSLSQLALGVQFLDALHYVHEHGIIHRDLKPANVMLTSDGNLKLIDFGVAFHPIESSGSTIVGSLQYTDPAILAGTGPSLSSDYYSFVISMLEAALAERIWPELAPLPLYQHIEHQGEKHIRRLLHRLHPTLAICLDKLWHLTKKPSSALENDSQGGKGQLALGLEDREEIKKQLNEMQVSLKFLSSDSPQQIIARLHQPPTVHREPAASFRLKEQEQVAMALSDALLPAKAQGFWLSYSQRLGISEFIAQPSVGKLPTRRSSMLVTIASLILGLGMTTWIAVQHRLGAKDSQENVISRNNAKQSQSALFEQPVIEKAALAPAEPIKEKALRPAPTPLTSPPDLGATKYSERHNPPKPSKNVRIHANAWADIFLGEKNLGRIPNAKGFQLPLGSHRLTLKSPYIQTTHFTVKVSDTSSADLRLEVPLRTKVIELLTLPDWTVEIRGKKWEQHDRHQVSLAYGEHEALISTNSKPLGTIVITVAPDSPALLDLTKHF